MTASLSWTEATYLEAKSKEDREMFYEREPVALQLTTLETAATRMSRGFEVQQQMHAIRGLEALILFETIHLRQHRKSTTASQ
jgi:hypothetical protein